MPLVIITARSWRLIQAKIQALGKSKSPRVQLVSGLNAEGVLLGSPAIKWYLDHGLVITRVYQFIEFRGQPIFKNLIEKFTDIRWEATAQGDTATANRKKLYNVIVCLVRH